MKQSSLQAKNEKNNRIKGLTPSVILTEFVTTEFQCIMKKTKFFE